MTMTVYGGAISRTALIPGDAAGDADVALAGRVELAGEHPIGPALRQQFVGEQRLREAEHVGRGRVAAAGRAAARRAAC